MAAISDDLLRAVRAGVCLALMMAAGWAVQRKLRREPILLLDEVAAELDEGGRAVLVECGFLSNAEEDRLLQEPAYQMKLAITMAACYLSSGSSQEGESFV